MPLIPEHIIEQVRQSVDIVDVISDQVMLTRRGKNFLGLCPFHDDHSPSFNVSQDKQIYKCFVCGAGGNVFKFVMEIERISFVEAVRKLADQAGVQLPEFRAEDREQQASFDALYRANELARKYFSHLLLKDTAGAAALKYLQDRGITQETVEAFALGYAPNAWDGLLGVAGRRGIDPQTLERAGLALPRRDGNRHYDRFRNRVMFPIDSATGRTVAFGARALDPEEQAKYLNSPETPVYHKSATLYGLWKDRDAIRTQGTALVVEGYMDLIALAQYGIENVVASAGTALTADHARMLRRYAERAVLVFDGDAAGIAAAVRGVESLFGVDLEVRVISLPQGHDPDSYVREHGSEAFLALIEGAQPALDFLIAWVATREDLSTADGKARAAAILAEFLSRVKDGARRRFLIQETAEKFGVDEGTVIQALRQAPRQRAPRPDPGAAAQPAQAPAFDPRPRAERELISWMMADDAVADAVLAQVRPEEFANSFYRRIAGIIQPRRQQGQTAEAAVLLDQCGDPNLAHVISTLSMEGQTVDPDQQALPLDDYIHKFRLRNLDAQMDALESEMKSAAPGTDFKALLEKHRGLTLRRKTLAEGTQ